MADRPPTSGKRRRVIVLLLLVLPPILLAAYLWFWPDSPGTLTRGNFNRVQTGVSVGDVQAILGPPQYSGIHKETAGIPGHAHWETDAAMADVYLDTTGAVSQKRYGERVWHNRLRALWGRAFGKPAPF